MRGGKFDWVPGAGRQAMRRLARSFIAGAVGAALLLQPAVGVPAWTAAKASAASAANGKSSTAQLLLTGETPVTSGAVRRTYEFIPANGEAGGKAKVHVIAVDMTNPYVSLNAMVGGGTVPGKSTVGNMVKETGAVAGVNADYFDMSSSEAVPFGFHIANGELIKSPRKLDGMYMFGITSSGLPVIDRFTLQGNVFAANGAKFELSGINEASYWNSDGSASHANALYLYTSSWTAAERPGSSGTTPTEALVQDGVVVQVSDNAALPVRPPANGYILRGHGQAARFILDNLIPGTKVTTAYVIQSASTGATYSADDWRMMVGGHTILVDGGVPAAYSRSVSSLSPNADRARTAIGYSQDKKTVYLVTVEKSGSSAGATLSELQQILVMLGVWRGINLDGGGSTTMISRPLGEFETKLAHPTEDGGSGTYQRPVVNGIGVYTSAPQGKPLGVAISGKQVLFIGEQATYALKAYDEYYNPLDPSGLAAVWSLDTPELGSLTGNVLQPARAGTGTLTVKSGGASDQLALEVIGEAQIVRMSIDAAQTELAPGASIRVPVSVELSDGRKLSVPAESVKWEFRGFTGTVRDGVLQIASVRDGADAGYAIARYDGYSALLTLKAGSERRLFEDFENVRFAIEPSVVPAEVKAETSFVYGLPGRDTSTALRLGYDFSTSAEERTKAAYAVFGGQGVELPGQPTGLSVEVFGDYSGHMVRAMIADAAGKDHLVDLAKSIDWYGWKTLKADLTAYPIAYPVKLKSLYVASPQAGQADRPASGEVYFDDIVLHYPAASVEPKGETIVLKLGSREATVGGRPVSLDVAPIAKDGVTYLPLRFVADQLGGTTEWDGQTKKVTVLRGERMLELWFGKDTIVANGERKAAPAQPYAEKGRTLVPIRLVSEQLGLRVDWNQADQSVTIR